MDALTAFGLQASDSAHFADILAAASSNSNTNVSMLGESFKYVAPLMGSMGYSAEDCSVALSLMANAGIKGSQSGTSLKTALTNMLSPTDSMAAVMNEYGLSLTNADGSMKSLQEVMIMLREKMGGLDEATQGAAASTLFGKEAMSGMLAIINASDSDFEKLTGAIANCDGTAESMAETMQDNVKGSLDELSSALEGVALALYDKFKGPLKNAIDSLAEAFSNLVTKLENGDLDGIISAIGAALLTLTAAYVGFKTAVLVGGIVDVFKNLFLEIATGTPILQAFNTVLGLNPFTMIAVAISAVVGALVYLWNTNEGFREAVTNAWNTIKEVAETVWGGICDFFTETIPTAWNTVIELFNGAGEWFSGIWNSIKETAINVWNGITEAVINAWNGVVDFFVNLPTNIGNALASIGEWIGQKFTEAKDRAVEIVTNMISSIVAFFTDLPYKIGYALGFLIGKVAEAFNNIKNFITVTVPQIIQSIVTFFSELPGKVWTWLVNTYNKVCNWATNTWNKAKETGSNFLNAIVEFFSQLPGRVGEFVSSTYNRVSSWASNMWSKAVETGSNFLNSISEWFSQLPGRIWDWLSNTLNRVSEFASNLGSKASEAGSNMVSNIINAVTNLPSQMASIGSQIVQGVWNGICGMGDWLYSQVSSFFSGIVDGVKDALGIHSPSRVFRDEVGRYMAQGVGVGFTNEEEKVQKDINNSLDDVIANVKTQVLFENARSIPTGAMNNSYYTTENTIENNDFTGLKEYIEQIANRPIKIAIDGQEFIEATSDNLEEFMIEKIRGR